MLVRHSQNYLRSEVSRMLNCRGGPLWPTLLVASHALVGEIVHGNQGRPRRAAPTLSIEKSRIGIELRVCDVAFADWVHCDVVEVLLEVGVVADNVIEHARLPETLLEKMFWLNARPGSQFDYLGSQGCSPVHQAGD